MPPQALPEDARVRPVSAPGERQLAEAGESRRKRAATSLGDREISSSPVPAPSPSPSPNPASARTPPSVQIVDDELNKEGFRGRADDRQACARPSSNSEAMEAMEAMHEQLVAAHRMVVAGQQLREELCRELEASKAAEASATRTSQVMEAEMSVLRLELGAIQHDASRLTEENEKLKYCYSACEAERDQAMRRLGEVLRTLRSEQQASLSQQLHLEQAMNASEELRIEVTQFKQEIAELRAQQSDCPPRDIGEDPASSEHMVPEHELTLCSARLSEVVAREQELCSEMQDLKRSLGHEQHLVVTMQEDLRRAQRALSAREEAHEGVEQDLIICQQQIKEDRETVKLLQEKLLMKTVELKDAEEQVVQLTSVKAELMLEFVELQHDFQETTKIAETIKEEQDRANEEFSELKVDLESCQQERLQSRAELVRVKLQLEMSNNEKERLACQVEKQMHIVNVLREEEMRLRLEAGDSRKEQKLAREIETQKAMLRLHRKQLGADPGAPEPELPKQVPAASGSGEGVCGTASGMSNLDSSSFQREISTAAPVDIIPTLPRSDVGADIKSSSKNETVPVGLIRKQILRADRAPHPQHDQGNAKHAQHLDGAGETSSSSPRDPGILGLQAMGSEDGDNEPSDLGALTTPDPVAAFRTVGWSAGSVVSSGLTAARSNRRLDFEDLAPAVIQDASLLITYDGSRVFDSSFQQNDSSVARQLLPRESISVPLTVVEGRKPARAVCVGLDAAVAPRSASLRESVNPEMRDSNDNGVHWPIMDTGKKVGNETRTLATSVMTSSNDGRPLGNPTSIFSPSGSIQNGKNGPFAVPLSQRVFKDSTSSNTPPAKMSAIASLSTTPRAGLRQPSSLLQYNASIQGQPRYGDMPSRSAQQHQPVRGKHHMQNAAAAAPAPKPLPRSIPSARDISNLVRWSDGKSAGSVDAGGHQLPGSQHAMMQASYTFDDGAMERRRSQAWQAGPAMLAPGEGGSFANMRQNGGRARSDLTDYFYH